MINIGHPRTLIWFVAAHLYIDFRYARLCYLEIQMVELFANSGYPDQTPRSAASDLGLHCLPITLIGVSRLQ